MQTIFVTSLVAVLAAVAAWKMKPEKEPIPPPPPLITVQEMGVLASLKVNYSDVIEFNEKVTQDIPWTQWELRFGGTRILLVAKGDCLIGTDLKLAKYEQSSPTAKTATLALQNPKVISAKLNHDTKAGGSYFYSLNSTGIAALMPGNAGQLKAANSALQKGQARIEASCASADLIQAAKRSAEAVLLPTVSATGWRVSIVWR